MKHFIITAKDRTIDDQTNNKRIWLFDYLPEVLNHVKDMETVGDWYDLTLDQGEFMNMTNKPIKSEIEGVKK